MPSNGQGCGVEEVLAAPPAFALHPSSPNPSRHRATIAFDLPVATRATIRIYHPDGRLIATVTDRVFEPGRHAMVWDGRDAAGQPVRSGVYLYLLDTPAFKRSGKLVIAR
jgi:hypothetical protein